MASNALLLRAAIYLERVIATHTQRDEAALWPAGGAANVNRRTPESVCHMCMIHGFDLYNRLCQPDLLVMCDPCYD